MPDTRPKCILIVEDDEPIRDLMSEILNRVGYTVETAGDGLQALELVKASPPDVIVLDLMMPIMDGWTFLRQFRTDPHCDRTPILVTSAYRELRETARELDVQAYLTKPFDIGELLGAIEHLL